MLIGVTGQIGAGKSQVAALLRQLGALVIDADKVGKTITGSKSILPRLIKIFGLKIVSPSGRLRPKILGRIVFSDSSGDSLGRLNSLVSKPLVSEIRRLIRSDRRKRPIVIDAALLPDWDLQNDLDLLITVTATRETRIRRLIKRGLKETEARQRLSRQRPQFEYSQIADIVIANNGSPAQLKTRIKSLWNSHILTCRNS